MAIAVTPKNKIPHPSIGRVLRKPSEKTVLIIDIEAHGPIKRFKANDDRPIIIVKKETNPKPPTKHNCNMGIRAKTTERNKQIAEYYVEGNSLDDCAAKFECGVSSVRLALKNNGVQTRDKQGREKK